MKRIESPRAWVPQVQADGGKRREAAKALGVEYELVKITDLDKFVSYGLMMTPGLVVDGELKVQGQVPSVKELKSLLG